ncbi:glycosyltransferase family 2 protein [Phormidium tenue FACHB-886]|nr:glycosyltransferase family 2 protein [Phormidium tenue FACHB-886]
MPNFGARIGRQSVDFTVAIPTYNGEQRLPAVLEQLQSQVSNALSWEVLVIDNNSHDRTAEVVQRFQANFPVPLRYQLEVRQGVGYARQTAIHNAASDLVGFLDDDNLPDPDWVNAAYQFAQLHPQAGAYGSRIQGEFDAPPPQTLHRVLPFLAITDRGSKALKYEPCKKLLPPGAGLVVRRQAWLDSVVPSSLSNLNFRRSDGNDCSEDLEALLHIQRSNWEIWYNPAMRVRHKIPGWRLERSYLMPLFRSIGLSRHATRMLSVPAWKRPLIFWAYLANDLRRIVSHCLKYRTQIKTDLAAACEMQLFVSSFVSPFYLWKKRYFSKRTI